ncbi:MAG TPA: hypothetical protein VMI11_14945 [Actinomycetes bacterium]|nr:hypothetical protein [Actinomycetes bacterium]
MSTSEVETRTVTTLSRGARGSVVVALLLLLAAGFVLVVPIERPTLSGAPFRCGTAAQPAAGSFAASVCSGLVRQRQLQAAGLGLAALVVVAGGLWTFGTTRRTERGTRNRDGDTLFADHGQGPAAD